MANKVKKWKLQLKTIVKVNLDVMAPSYEDAEQYATNIVRSEMRHLDAPGHWVSFPEVTHWSEHNL